MPSMRCRLASHLGGGGSIPPEGTFTAVNTHKGKKKMKLGTRFGDIRQGDIMAFTHFVKVDTVTRNPSKLHVSDVDSGGVFDVIGEDLIENATSADRFTATKAATKTELAEILVRSWNQPFTVTFEKATGEKRILRGRLVEPEPLLGRSKVQDFDKGGELRLVDHRTIESLIVGGTKYTLKAR